MCHINFAKAIFLEAVLAGGHFDCQPAHTVDSISVLQQNSLRWYGHVLRKEDNDWVKKCMEYEVEGAGPRGRPKIVEKDCQARGLNREDAMDRSR